VKAVLHQRFGFLVNEVGRLYSQQFDRLARQRLGLSQAQCRLLFLVDSAGGDEPPSQAELAQRMGVTPMAVAALCDRMAAAGWIERWTNPVDRRVKHFNVSAKAHRALERAMAIGDELTTQVLAGLGPADRRQLIALLSQARAGLQKAAAEGNEA
jgi:DNA-binding MarR family transcriptional regulator